MDSHDKEGLKHYSPSEIMNDHCLHANDLQLVFGIYCQVTENVEPRNSLAPRMRAAILMGNSGNLFRGSTVPCIGQWPHYS
jgi:hypothetical protein